MADKKRIFSVLVIDGGGVRGIIPARILECIEERTGKPISQLFDLVGGVSTGAIVAGGLNVPHPDQPGKPKYSAREVKEFYFNRAPKIFPASRFTALRQITSSAAYDPRPLEETLDMYFGDMRIRDSLVSIMIPTIDIKNFKPAWISSVKGQKDTSPEGWSSMMMKDAIRGATTAPTYFPAKYVNTTPNPDVPGVQHRHALIDGGFFTGNAMRRMLTQAKKLAPPDSEIVVVHVGTGMVGNSLSPDEWNKLGPLGMLSKQRGSVLMSLAINIGILDMAEDLKNELGDHFVSLNGNINYEDTANDPSSEMDDAGEKNMKLLESFADRIVAENGDEFTRLCKMLEDRLFREQDHNRSAEALAELARKMDAIYTVKSLTRMYRQVLKATNSIGDKPVNAEAAEIHNLAVRLTEKDRAELDKIYNLQHDKLSSQNGLMNSVKEAGESIDRMFKKLTGSFNPKAAKEQDNKPPANDDDITPPAAGLDRAPKAKKQPWWKR